MNGELSLSCRDIERYLGEEESRVHVLRGVSLDLESGSIHAVVGPSGCGKSTLLYILGLLDEPDAGSVEVGATPISHLSDQELARRRNELIGFIFQFHFLMEDFSAHENVMIPMRRLGQMNETEMLERAAAYAKVWGKDGSPLLVHSRALQVAVQEKLGPSWRVELSMRYGEPSIETCVCMTSRRSLAS